MTIVEELLKLNNELHCKGVMISMHLTQVGVITVEQQEIMNKMAKLYVIAEQKRIDKTKLN